MPTQSWTYLAGYLDGHTKYDAKALVHPPNVSWPTQIIWSGFIDSDADLNILVKLLTKYVIIFYALGLAHEKFGVRIKAVPKSIQSSKSRLG